MLVLCILQHETAIVRGPFADMQAAEQYVKEKFPWTTQMKIELGTPIRHSLGYFSLVITDVKQP